MSQRAERGQPPAFAAMPGEGIELRPWSFGFEMWSSVVVDAPVQRTWEVVAEANRWPEWAEVCASVWGAPAGAEKWEPGRRFGFRLKMAMREVPFNVTVTRFEPDGTAEGAGGLSRGPSLGVAPAMAPDAARGRPSAKSPDQSPERLIEWTSTKFTITAVRTISIVATGDPSSGPGGCTVWDRKYFSSPVLPIGLAYPKWLIRRMTESWLRDLKREAESGR